MIRKLVLIFLLIFVLFPADGKNKHPEDTTWNEWHFRISPYFWYLGINGEILRPPQPTTLPIPPPPRFEINISFKDIRNSIKFAAMLAGKYRTGRFVTQFNFASLILESEAITPFELLVQDLVLNFSIFMGDLSAGYRIIHEGKFEFDVLLGVKLLYFDIGGRSKIFGSIPLEGERSVFWIDPVIGTNFSYRPIKRLELELYADYGGNMLGSQQSYQAIGGLNVKITRTFQIMLGYRIWGVKHEFDQAIFNGHAKGWYTRFGFQF